MKNNHFYLLCFLMMGMVLWSCSYEPYVQGKRLYQAFCANCHMDNGEGLRSLYPPLANSDYLEKNHDQLACIIANGMSGKIMVNGKEYDQAMAGVTALNDIEINNIINYINHAWGNNLGKSNIADVRANLEKCQQ